MVGDHVGIPGVVLLLFFVKLVAAIWYHAHTGLPKPQKTGHVGIPDVVLLLFFVKQVAAIWTRNLYQVP